MKTVTCDLCDATAQGKTFEEWMTNLQPHYMQAHPEVMSNPDGDMNKWMEENKARFDAAPEDTEEKQDETEEVKA